MVYKQLSRYNIFPITQRVVVVDILHQCDWTMVQRYYSSDRVCIILLRERIYHHVIKWHTLGDSEPSAIGYEITKVLATRRRNVLVFSRLIDIRSNEFYHQPDRPHDW